MFWLTHQINFKVLAVMILEKKTCYIQTRKRIKLNAINMGFNITQVSSERSVYQILIVYQKKGF